MTFTVPIVVRTYELDALGHVNQAVYLQYAEVARVEFMGAIGITDEKLFASGIAPVVLENHIRYRRELRRGEEITVGCVPVWGEGKTFSFEQQIHKLDGTLSAEVRAVVGVMDLSVRKLVADPAARFRELADNPDLIAE